MKITLTNKPCFDSARRQILSNRGVKDIDTYLQSNMSCINPPTAFGKELLSKAIKTLIPHIAAEDDILIIVDADCDGFTSSALLINYLYDCFPSFVENHVKWFIHDGKQHGLSDCIEQAKKFKMVIIPDAGSNDYNLHHELKENGADILILDHHEADHISEDAIVINNQLSDYPNKDLSGVGVTWQFCRYLDEIGGNTFANNYLDLVALGNMADMMSLLSPETKALIFEGFKEANIKNPFINAMAKKNEFSLNKSDYKPSENNGLMITPMGAAFFIAPLVNAIVRSGTMEEKALIFDSMLKFKAFEMILSNKRGHKLGELEQLVEQAIRTCTNVKNRQTRAEEAGMEKLEELIAGRGLLEHKVLLFLLEPSEIDKNIAGLVANKIANKYQRPVAVLTKREHEYDGGEMEYSTKAIFPILHVTGEKYYTYEGSARGCDAAGVANFKDICASAPGCIYAEGHQGAFGLGLRSGEDPEVEGEPIYQYLAYTDEVLKDLSSEPSYFVDYIWDVNEVDGDKIIEMADMNDYLGKDIERPLVFVKNIPVNSNNFKVMKSNTLKFECPKADVIQFGATDEQVEEFSTGSRTINAVCKCCKNVWNFQVTPQLILIDYEIVNADKSIAAQWGF